MSERERFEDHFNKAKVAAAVSGGFGVVSLLYPPAITGAFVAAGDMVRHIVAMNLMILKSPTDKKTTEGN